MTHGHVKPNVDWSKQHCGLRSAPFEQVLILMPDLREIVETFPDNPNDFTWDVKVHQLMPRQYPCIPNWHLDNVPRVNGVQRMDLIPKHLPPMYLWVSGPPLTQFQHGYVLPEKWHRFNQLDQHRGTASCMNTWRCFIRASHFDIKEPLEEGWLRRHSQVYLDSETFQW